MCMGMREFDIVNRASIINFDIEILINKQCCFMFFIFEQVLHCYHFDQYIAKFWESKTWQQVNQRVARNLILMLLSMSVPRQ